MKRVFELLPSRICYEVTTGEEINKILTSIILTATELTSNEIGLYGSSMFWDTEEKMLCLLTKFNLNQVLSKSKGFGQENIFIPELKKLEGILYSGNIDDYIFDMNEKENEITFNWHSDIALAYIANVSLVDPKYKLGYEILEKQKTDKKKTAVAVKMSIFASISNKGETTPYDADEISTWIDMMQG